MEKVQFQLEQTLPELKDLHDKGLFTKREIDQITKKRTAFETSLIRRDTRKDDFFKYAEYEINLERLRKVRWNRLGYNINPPPPSASLYSLPRRAAYILKRATVKFPGDLATWLAHVEFASREGMRKAVIKGLTTAMQHHPLSPTLYLLMSYHHLHPTSPFPRDVIPSTSKLDLPSTAPEPVDRGFSLEGTSAARTQLLLGLRLIPASTELWTEYIKLELGWVEALRRRWNVLGISDTIEGGDTSVQAETLTGGEGSFGPDGEDARKSILSGQLVIHAIHSALEAIQGKDRLPFRLDLVDLFRTYPSALRAKALAVVYTDLESQAKGKGRDAAQAKLAVITKTLYDSPYVPGEENVKLSGVELVEEIGRVGKEIRKRAKDGSEWLEVAGKWLVEQIEGLTDNPELLDYLLSVLSALTAAKYNPPPRLLISQYQVIKTIRPGDHVEIARKHAAQYPSNAILQQIRLEAEVEHGSTDLELDFQTAVTAVSPREAGNEEEDVRAVWFTWTAYEEEKVTVATTLDAVWDSILKLSARINRTETHVALLGRFFISLLQRPSPPPALKTIETFVKYRVSEAFYPIAFAAVQVYSASPYDELSRLYEVWRRAAEGASGRILAALTWAAWLLRHKKAHEASRIVDSVRREDEAQVESLWKELCDEPGVEEERGDKVDRLETRLGQIGWAGLATSDGVLVEDDEEESEQGDEDEEMGDQGSDGEDDDGEDEDGEESEDEEMDINV